MIQGWQSLALLWLLSAVLKSLPEHSRTALLFVILYFPLPYAALHHEHPALEVERYYFYSQHIVQANYIKDWFMLEDLHQDNTSIDLNKRVWISHATYSEVVAVSHN